MLAHQVGQSEHMKPEAKNLRRGQVSRRWGGFGQCDSALLAKNEGEAQILWRFHQLGSFGSTFCGKRWRKSLYVKRWQRVLCATFYKESGYKSRLQRQKVLFPVKQPFFSINSPVSHETPLYVRSIITLWMPYLFTLVYTIIPLLAYLYPMLSTAHTLK